MTELRSDAELRTEALQKFVQTISLIAERRSGDSSALEVNHEITSTHQNIHKEEDGTLYVLPGSRLEDVIWEAIILAALDCDTVSFDFNGVRITIDSDSNISLIKRDWSRAMDGYIDKHVGPNPTLLLTEEELASDARIEQANAITRQARRAKYQAEAKAHQARVNAKLMNAPAIELIEGAVWESETESDMGNAVRSYAERWAKLMQLEMAAGNSLEEVAGPTCHEADLEGISGLMNFGATVLLSQVWKHGEQLKIWHNLKYGDQGEAANESGALINPTVLRFAPSVVN